MNLVKKILPLVAIGALALGVSSCNHNSGLDDEDKHSPAIKSEPVVAVNEGQSYGYQIEASDKDGDKLDYSLLTAPAWISVDKNGLVSGTAPIVDWDTVTPVSVKVSDGDKAVTQEFNIRVKDLETRDIITKAADRLIALQDVNGSWDWVVTNRTASMGENHYNLAGVTGEGLLSAYLALGDAKYLDAAKRAGDMIVNTTISSSQRQNSAAVTLLQHLAEKTGISYYENKADEIMEHLFRTSSNSFSAGFDKDGIAGLNAQELLNAYIDYRKDMSNPNGVVPWDLFQFVEAAKKWGDTALASDIANKINGYLTQAGFTNSVDYSGLGVASGVISSINGGLSYNSLLERLASMQNSDGSFGTRIEGFPQGTAYALNSLIRGKSQDASRQALVYLKNNFGYSGINGWPVKDETDPSKINEYAEINSEVVDSFAKFISE